MLNNELGLSPLFITIPWTYHQTISCHFSLVSFLRPKNSQTPNASRHSCARRAAYYYLLFKTNIHSLISVTFTLSGSTPPLSVSLKTSLS
ncbi:uncharacterized protein F5891DRAFT_1039151 [Suillus fuscotomentosus]|uniref:Uncharacterized protein n=1 Tax=Suillus fuscotomentosus TaxID=1912939 RepID=A0AAD4E510_9AGAM|nr:uncharacterized protein F5891DRAFT_1039147 [Suillus fuscotomentosus]XP_041224948.1 uncharacterized protein F5891DRAFT_1039151 [Suillus fuscotomentosus]KAG1899371.1 hypothetical protein F5891DRAFT_1039147 [Suillus fuscotomentosus]KAG1899372.1 hypothetical protein F5891DRAFT_1039151 [Suillus fuscotomentosus]